MHSEESDSPDDLLDWSWLAFDLAVAWIDYYLGRVNNGRILRL